MKLPDLEYIATNMLVGNGPIVADSDDLTNSLFVLMEIALSLAWYHHANLTHDQRVILVEEFGKNIRQSMTLFTGVDPADAVVQYGEWADTLEDV